MRVMRSRNSPDYRDAVFPKQQERGWKFWTRKFTLNASDTRALMP